MEDRDPTDLGLPAVVVPRGTSPVSVREMRELPAGELAQRLAAIGLSLTPEQIDRMDADARAAEAAALEREAGARRQARIVQLASYGMPTKDLEALAVDQLEASEAKAAIERFSARHAVERRSCIQILIGEPGSGKTCAAAWWLCQRGAKHPYVTTSDPLFMTAARISRTSSFDGAALERIELAERLVIDDLGNEYLDAKGAFAAKLHMLIDARYEHLLPTVITCSMTPEDLRRDIGKGVASRFEETAMMTVVKGNFRKRA